MKSLILSFSCQSQEIVGHVAIDKITVGKLIAFFEMQKQNMMSETVSES